MSGLVPKLRFKQDDGSNFPTWKKCKFGIFVEEFKQNSTKQDEYEVLTSARSGLIRQKDYYDNDRITERINAGFNIIPCNYMTYRSRSDNRRFYFNENNLGITGIISTYYPVFKIKNGINKFFIELLFYHQHKIGQYSVGTSQTVLSINELKKIYFSVPSLPEQQKIAGFLSSVDAKIDAVKRKLNAFERYKKGLMQQIFTQKIRFKQDNGSDFPEWEEKRLGDVAAVNSGLAIDQNERKSGYKVTRIETISDGSINLSKIGYVDTNNDISNYLLNEGDILFSNINSVKHIGKIALINNERELYHGMNLLRIIPSNKINSLFLYSYLKTTPLKRHFERVCNQAVSQASINQTELKKTKIVFPSLPEQQKIADFLSSVDAKIDAIKSQIEKLEAFKKGLLQQMFV